MTNLGKQLIPKCPDFALLDHPAADRPGITAKGFERLFERPDQPSRRKVGCYKHHAPEHRALTRIADSTANFAESKVSPLVGSTSRTSALRSQASQSMGSCR
ncbi:hypothetical protein [Rhizobium leguminosarum]|uniref:Uncharacterized protein n=1 Tax=Rhizobium leguminosarum TaxID=384 RepID=A0A7W9ZVU4_RHILE|nr:hypothetical protein [Rhizobium leguminosarum]MBB5662952.1 hypothetical protein [Rhizobium leguminosarum]MBB6222534.1 hypothetical protein [Rhizobium leguminosarum]